MIILRKQKIIKYFIIIVGIVSTIIFLSLDMDSNVLAMFKNKDNIGYEILVDVEESVLYLFQDKQVIKTYKCSGGKWSTPSPIGTWEIIGKDTWGEGFRR